MCEIKMKKGAVYIILAGIFWGTMGLFVHELTDYFRFSSLQASSLRITTAAIIISLVILFTDKKKFKINIKDLPLFFCLGLISVLCMTAFYFGSISSGTSMSVSAILLYTAPVHVTVASCFVFREKFTKAKAVALFVALIGCVLVSFSPNVTATPKGIIFGILSSFAYASYSIFSGLLLKKGYPALTVTVYAFLIAGIGSICICGFPQEVDIIINNLSVKLVLTIFFTGLVTAVAPFLLYTKGLETTPASSASIMACVEPLCACVCGLFRGEKLTAPVICGMICIVVAICVLNVKIKKEK